MVLGGRYLRAKVDSEFMGKPFEGMEFTGYDPIKKQFVNLWLDSGTNTPMMQFGTASADGNTITFTGDMPDPTTGKTKKTRSVIDMSSKDKMKCDCFETGPDGAEFKSMELTYKRKAQN